MDASGSPLTDASSGKFLYAGQEANYTQLQDIQFDNTGQTITFTFKPTNSLLSGKYFVEIYCENYMIGSTTFSVK
jgi:outer membrane translocation and assembly module TamA